MSESPYTVGGKRPSGWSLIRWMAATCMLSVVVPQSTFLQAQEIPNPQDIPGPLQPTRPGADLIPPPAPFSEPAPPVQLTGDQLAPDQAEAITFLLNGVVLEGAEALSAADFADLWEPHLGQTVSVATLFDLVNGITRRYADLGYALSLAVLPAQTIENGVVFIRAVEGYIDRVVFTGDKLESLFGTDRDTGNNALLQVFAASLTASRPLRTDDLERYLLLINDLPGVTAQAVFAASAENVGASTITLHVTRKQADGQIGVNNHMTGSVGNIRQGGSVGFNGLFTGGDRLSFDLWRSSHAARNSSRRAYVYAGVQWSQMIGYEGLKIGLSASYSNTRPRDNGLMAILGYTAYTRSYGLSFDYPLLRSRQRNAFFGVSVDVLDSRSYILSGQPFTADSIRTLSTYLSYDFVSASRSVSMLRAGLTQGLRGFGATQDGDPLRSRGNGSAVFTNLDFYGLYSRPLTDALSIQAQIQGQVAIGNPLLSAAECGYGGRSFGRGYDGGALSGDHCLNAALELRWNRPLAPNLGLQAYGFVDGGLVFQKGQLLPGEHRAEHAFSWGGGLRVQYSSWLSGHLEMAMPIQAEFAPGGDRSPRFFLSLSAQF